MVQSQYHSVLTEFKNALISSRKLAPILHSIRTLPSMILETAHIPVHILRQESDWKKLCDRFPGLDQYFLQEHAIRELLHAAYQDYVSQFSSSLISLSLNRASFLFFFSQLIQAKNILDLGSGFSSYVFRMYAQQAGLGVVTSVDDSDSWLMETQRFLTRYNIESTQLLSLHQYVESNKDNPSADLCLLDLGDIALRQQLLPDLFYAVENHQMLLVIDDFHVPVYRRFITKLCMETNITVYSLRKATRRRLSHMALIMKSP